ncbi:hypothetical protein [Paenibacillus sp. FSL P4-0184]|uniref:hypothetical protein n=1 Tax=Paenibacillus sp. FSL P4-0184 TaxID=2921632 RepID=UPI0030FB1625
MKAITIIQPWATLIALREKKFETRSWPTKYRGLLAIHAGKKIDKEACREPEIRKALERHGYTEDNLSTGAVVAICKLSNCLKSVDTWREGYELRAGSLFTPLNTNLVILLRGDLPGNWQSLISCPSPSQQEDSKVSGIGKGREYDTRTDRRDKRASFRTTSPKRNIEQRRS